MFGRGITLFRVFGFEVRVDASWAIIAALVVWSLRFGLFPAWYPGLRPSSYWWMGILGALGLFGSIVAHELAHSLVARRHGIRMKGITLFIFGGVAEMPHEPPNARSELLMAIAGPIASILTGFLSYGLYLAGRGPWPVELAGILAYLAWINWILAAFNLLPAFPLDGGRVLRAALWHFKGNLPRATRIASRIGGGFGLALMVLAVLQLFAGNFVGAVWWFLIGMFLRSASQMSYQQVVVRTVLEGEPVRRLMTPDPITVPPGVSIRELVDDYVYRHHHKMFPVVGESQRLLGCVSAGQIRTVPREEWAQRRVEEIVQPCNPENTVTPDTDALKLLSLMSQSGASRVMVVEQGRLVAVITLRDLLKFISSKLALGDYSSGDGQPLDLPAEASEEERQLLLTGR